MEKVSRACTRRRRGHNLATMMGILSITRASGFAMRAGAGVPLVRGRGIASFVYGEIGARSSCKGPMMSTLEETTDPQTPSVVDVPSNVNKLRSWMSSVEVDAFIVPSDDPHLSEYSAECFNRRAFISGFTGSAGTAVILQDEALLWTDGRYHVQAEQQLCDGWTLMKAGKPGVPSISAFLAKRLCAGARVGVDPFVHSAAFAEGLMKEFKAKSIELSPLEHTGGGNPVDKIWGSKRPSPPQEPVRVHELKYAGETVQNKLEKVSAALSKEGTDVLLVCMLDEVAYLLNIRGSDVTHCPVTMAYALVSADGSASLFVDKDKIDEGVKAELEACSVNIYNYNEALDAVRQLSDAGKRFWIDPERVNFALHNIVPKDRVVTKPSPITLAKGIKNEAELEGMRVAHVRDGVAMAHGLAMLEKEVGAGKLISEVDVDRLVTSFRAKQDMFLDLSFPTIAGADSNGAIIHYSAQPESCRIVGKTSMLLLDSGAQYKDGTTDVTRTVHFGDPSLEQKEAYTRVLKGHIALATAKFPDGTPGFMVDSFARKALWEAGMDYQHGTGHGVGAALNVHEGPHSISPRTANSTPLKPGMVVSNEPGYYKGGDGGFGVRIENLLEIVDSGVRNEALGRSFYHFEPLTLIPIQKKLLDLSLLTAEEEQWLNAYHQQVWSKISPFVEDTETLEWLKESTLPVLRP